MDRINILEELSNDFQRLQRTWKHYFHMILDDDHVSPAQIGLLFYLREHQPVSGKKIASLIQISPSAVTQLLDGLDKAGYISREHDSADRRVMYIRLSNQGTARMDELDEKRKQFFKEATDVLSDEELAVMRTAQRKMMEQMEQKLGDKQ